MVSKSVKVSKCQSAREKDGVYTVIMIGGKGKRLRPLSTNARPKAFLSVTKDRKTMFQRTIRRALRITPSLSRIVVVANRAHLANVKRDVRGLDRKNLLLEPISRNTAPAIALASRFLKEHAGDPIVVVLPADQYILDVEKYASAVKRGVDFIRCHGDTIVILGHKPSYPSPEFGYIRVKGHGSRVKGNKIVKVERFVEKPDLAAAKKYVKSGKYLWNTGAFIFRVTAILRALKRHAPDVYYGLPAHDKGLSKAYQRIPDIAIDRAVIEKADNVYCVAGDYRWQDMGSFDALRTILRREGRRFIEVNGKIVKIL